MTVNDIMEAARLAESKSDGIVTVYIEARSDGIWVEGAGRRDRFSKEWRSRRVVSYRDDSIRNPITAAVEHVFHSCREAVRTGAGEGL